MVALRPGLFVTNDSNDLVSPRDARLALAGLLSGPGVLAGGGVSGDSTGSPIIRYLVQPGVWVVARGSVASDGLYVVSSDAVFTASSGAAAPVSGSRYDLVWIRQNNAFSSDGFGDSDSSAEIGVTVGTADAAPVKPSLPAGALELATVLVPNGAANGAGATVTNTCSAAGTTRVTTIDDWDKATTPGVVYRGSNAAHGPGAYEYMGWCFTSPIGSTQVVVRVSNSGTTAAYLGQWQRMFDGSSWGAWSRVVMSSDGSTTDLTDTGWVVVTLGSGGGSYPPALGYRVRGGVVYLAGGYGNDTDSSGSVTLGVLPVVARPPWEIRVDGEGRAFAIIGTNGTVTVYYFGNGNLGARVTGISYPAVS